MKKASKEIEEVCSMLDNKEIPFIFMSKDDESIKLKMQGSHRDLILIMVHTIINSNKVRDLMFEALKLIENNENK